MSLKVVKILKTLTTIRIRAYTLGGLGSVKLSPRKNQQKKRKTEISSRIRLTQANKPNSRAYFRPGRPVHCIFWSKKPGQKPVQNFPKKINTQVTQQSVKYLLLSTLIGFFKFFLLFWFSTVFLGFSNFSTVFL